MSPEEASSLVKNYHRRLYGGRVETEKRPYRLVYHGDDAVLQGHGDERTVVMKGVGNVFRHVGLRDGTELPVGTFRYARSLVSQFNDWRVVHRLSEDGLPQNIVFLALTAAKSDLVSEDERDTVPAPVTEEEMRVLSQRGNRKPLEVDEPAMEREWGNGSGCFAITVPCPPPKE